jgi:hypothetical protein
MGMFKELTNFKSKVIIDISNYKLSQQEMGNQGMGGGGRRNPFGGQMTEEEKKRARERRQEECKSRH